MAALRSANGLPPLGPDELAKLAHGMSLDPAVLNALDISLSSQEALHRGPPAIAAHALPPRPMQALSHESVSHVMCRIVARPWGGGRRPHGEGRMRTWWEWGGQRSVEV